MRNQIVSVSPVGETYCDICIPETSGFFPFDQRLPVFHGCALTLQPSTVNAQFSRDASKPTAFPLLHHAPGVHPLRPGSNFHSAGSERRSLFSFYSLTLTDMLLDCVYVTYARCVRNARKTKVTEVWTEEKFWRTGNEKLSQFSTFCTVNFEPTNLEKKKNAHTHTHTHWINSVPMISEHCKEVNLLLYKFRLRGKDSLKFSKNRVLFCLKQ